jgi:hypothetical protein
MYRMLRFLSGKLRKWRKEERKRNKEEKETEKLNSNI